MHDEELVHLATHRIVIVKGLYGDETYELLASTPEQEVAEAKARFHKDHAGISGTIMNVIRVVHQDEVHIQ